MLGAVHWHFGRKRNGAPERIRTSDPQIRSLMLYPAELRARSVPLKAAWALHVAAPLPHGNRWRGFFSPRAANSSGAWGNDPIRRLINGLGRGQGHAECGAKPRI